jgi:opacity protein-like surface antigen
VRLRRLFLPLLATLLATALPALAQDGIRVPVRPGAGIDPTLAGGWLNPGRERFGLGPYHWRDSIGFAPTQRLQWSYAFGSRSSVGMSMANGRDFASEPVFGADARQYGLIGRYSLAPDWSVSAETVSRDPATLFRLQDFRIGLRRQF